LQDTEFAYAATGTDFIGRTLAGTNEITAKRSQSHSATANALLQQLRLERSGAGNASASNPLQNIVQRSYSSGSIAAPTTAGGKQFSNSQQSQSARLAGWQISTANASVDGVNFWQCVARHNDKTEFFVKIGDSYYRHTDAHDEAKSWSGTSSHANAELTAPVPGKLLTVNCKPGDRLAKNQTAFVIESMKMEFEIKATKDGTIAKVYVQAGAQINAGDRLASWTEDGTDAP